MYIHLEADYEVEQGTKLEQGEKSMLTIFFSFFMLILYMWLSKWMVRKLDSCYHLVLALRVLERNDGGSLREFSLLDWVCCLLAATCNYNTPTLSQ